MRRLNKVPFFVTLLALLLSASAWGYVYRHPAAQAIHDKTAASLTMGDVELPLVIDQVNEAYESLPLSEVSTEDRIELGYELQAWRRALGARVFARLSEPNGDAASLLTVLVHLRAAGDTESVARVMATDRVRDAIATGNRAVLEPLAQWLSTTEAGPHYRADIERWGFPEIAKSVGPGAFVPIHPVAHSAWPFGRWSSLPSSADYVIEGDEVVYRGLRLRTGDVVLVFQALDRDGLFTTITEKPAFLSHMGVFALIEKDGKRIPAVLEMHELGVRANPLSVELSSQMVSYAEVYRLKNAAPGFEKRVSEEALRILGETQRYDFSASNPHPRPEAMACTGLAACLWGRAGEKPLEGETTFNAEAMKNFTPLGLVDGKALSPNDYAQSDRLQLKGWIDNGQFEWNIARQITRDALGRALQNGHLDPNRLPLSYRFKAFAIRNIQNHTPLGVFMRQFTQFSSGNFPSGPPGVIALSQTLERKINPVVQDLWNHTANCGREFAQIGGAPAGAKGGGTFSYHDFLQSQGGRELFNQTTAQLQSSLSLQPK